MSFFSLQGRGVATAELRQAPKATFAKCLSVFLGLVALGAFSHVSAQAVVYDNSAVVSGYNYGNFVFVPTANGSVNHLSIQIDSSFWSSKVGKYVVAMPWCFQNSNNCTGAWQGDVGNDRTFSNISSAVLYDGSSSIDFYFPADQTQVLDYTQFSTARTMVFDIRWYDDPPTTCYDSGSGSDCIYDAIDVLNHYGHDGTQTSYTNFGSTYNAVAIVDGSEPDPEEPEAYPSVPTLFSVFPNRVTATTTPTFSVSGYTFDGSEYGPVFLLGHAESGAFYTVLNPLSSGGVFDVSTTTSYYSTSSPSSVSLGIATTTLPDGYYSGTVNLSDNYGRSLYQPVQFIVGSSIYGFTPQGSILPGQVFSSSTASTSPSDFLSFLNVPELLQTRIPFAYLFQIYPAFQLAISSSTPAEVGTVDLDIVWWNVSGTSTKSFTLFSTSTVTRFLPDPVLSPLRALLGATTYLGTAWFLYHHARNKKHLS